MSASGRLAATYKYAGSHANRTVVPRPAASASSPSASNFTARAVGSGSPSRLSTNSVAARAHVASSIAPSIVTPPARGACTTVGRVATGTTPNTPGPRSIRGPACAAARRSPARSSTSHTACLACHAVGSSIVARASPSITDARTHRSRSSALTSAILRDCPATSSRPAARGARSPTHTSRPSTPCAAKPTSIASPGPATAGVNTRAPITAPPAK